jgi:uncharacterized membrane protein required for colicin V production
MSLDKLPINAFDFVVVAVLVLGIFRGRKHGMSEELIGLLTWLAVLFGCAAVYDPLGKMLAQSSPFSLLSSYLMVYVVAALVILGLFALVRRGIGGKLVGSDLFGRAEYYLGVGSGMVRWSCILLTALALLNARYYSYTEAHAMEKYQDDLYGSNYFPTLHSVQSVVFEKSLIGSWIHENLAFLLIRPTEPEDKSIHQKEFTLP